MEYYKNADISAKAADVITEAAFTWLQEPGQKSGPPAQYGPTDGDPNDPFEGYKSRFSYIKGVFEKFLTPDPGGFDMSGTGLSGEFGLYDSFGITEPGKGLMTEAFPELDRLETAITKSDSHAFDNFATNFLDKFDLIWYNHASVAKVLGLAMTGVAGIYAQARKDLIDIGDLTIAGLKDAQNHDPLKGHAKELGVISFITGTIATIAAPIAPISVPAGIISVATGAESYMTDDKEHNGKQSNGKISITGSDAMSIVASMCDATIKLSDDIDAAQKALQSSLKAYNSALDKGGVRKYFIAPDVNFPDKGDV